VKATIWYERDRGAWAFLIPCGEVVKAGLRRSWQDALDIVLGELDAQRATRI
jgi:hypothetical protein